LKKFLWFLPFALPFTFICTLAWAFSKEDSPVQQRELSGYVLKGAIWMGGKPQEFFVQYAYLVPPDSVVVVIYGDTQDSTLVVYQRRASAKTRASGE